MIDTTFQIVVTNKCNAHCPYCISKQTPEVCKNYDQLKTDKFKKAVQFAHKLGITTCKIIGKGDPTLEIDAVHDYLHMMNIWDLSFPVIEFQTNGIGLTEEMLDKLQSAGVTTIALSCIGADENYRYYSGDYVSLPVTIKKVHDAGMLVRLSCCLVKDLVDTSEKVDFFITFAKNNKVEQISLIPVGWFGDSKQANWARKHAITDLVFEKIQAQGTELKKCQWGGTIYDYKDINVYIADCLGSDCSGYRYLLYYPDGHLRYSWTKKGAIIF
jgi:molybdenum cofactor biosynthesis enzyme MoaA